MSPEHLQLCADLHTRGSIWCTRDQVHNHYRESQRLFQTNQGLLWETLPANYRPIKHRLFDRYVLRMKHALANLPAWNLRLEMRQRHLRLYADRNQFVALLPEWRISWSMVSDGLGTQIGSKAILAKRPPFERWLADLKSLALAKPLRLQSLPERVYIPGGNLAFFLEDSLSHAAHKLTLQGRWQTHHAVYPASSQPPAWWDALFTSEMLFQPAELVEQSTPPFQAIAYHRETFELIMVSDNSYFKCKLGEPLHRFVKQLQFVGSPRTSQKILLKGVQWWFPDAILALGGVNP